MSNSTSNHNPKTNTLNITIKKENLNYISKFGLPISITHYIDSRFIFYDIYINNFIIISNIKLNS